ncbi:sensor histidine kinase [Nafulsella turpanensis]|uniref:sensor histidine kinase n=1 Tax=Nafulsella turpanensis TaxID=1265690 RepID=UPI00034B091E|nr:HAMP domain-containing sensor histidine kinase [Nafulsella turpanensis]
MSIRARLTWQFTLIVASILSFFFLAVYLFYADFRKEEFYSRLSKKALTTARFLIDVQEIDHDLLKIIDRNSLNALHNEKIYIFDRTNQLVYSSVDEPATDIPLSLLLKTREEGRVEYTQKMNETLGLFYYEGGQEYVIIASAFDVYGRRKLVNLRFVLLIGFFVSIGVTFVAGRLFAGKALRPIANINRQVAEINAESLHKRVAEGNGQDEIAQLAINFNKMLDRIASSFYIQKNFVNNASHELRTPVAAMISQLQVGLAKERSNDEYRKLLLSVLEDAQSLAELSNGLLALAQSETDKMAVKMAPLRIDEVLFQAQHELLKKKEGCHIDISFSEIPEHEDSLTVFGHEGMLKTLFLNLLDNACKFSFDQKAMATIAFEGEKVVVRVSDEGRGIPAEDQSLIFTPFYRAENVRQLPGHGLGLSICKKIIELHGGTIDLHSLEGKGSTFSIKIPQVK